ncbi:MAG: PqqD family protein [Bacteroidota bacterium]|nr:PqqD family protein [Bacteroidota bacterium]
MFRKRRAGVNLLSLVPERLFAHTVNADGRVVVDMPRFHVAWMQKYLVPRSRSPYIKITLDRFGSHVWTRIDGRADVRDIAESLRGTFGEEAEPVEERLAVFMHQLERRGFIRFRTKDSPHA